VVDVFVHSARSSREPQGSYVGSCGAHNVRRELEGRGAETEWSAYGFGGMALWGLLGPTPSCATERRPPTRRSEAPLRRGSPRLIGSAPGVIHGPFAEAASAMSRVGSRRVMSDPGCRSVTKIRTAISPCQSGLTGTTGGGRYHPPRRPSRRPATVGPGRTSRRDPPSATTRSPREHRWGSSRA
jgi:hypothetical protein